MGYLGPGYKNDQACSTLIEFFARDQQHSLRRILIQSKFFILQADDSTDAGNIEVQSYLVVYLDLRK